MPEVRVMIGGREFEVACQEGEQPFLEAAAAQLHTEASRMSSQLGRMPETRMLLMSGLMLADKTQGLEEQVSLLEEQVAQNRALIEELQSKPAPSPERIEVPVIPAAVTDALAELTARAESLAQDMEGAEG